MPSLRDIVCERFCSYHRPDHFVEPGCAGFVFLDDAARPVDLPDIISRVDPSGEELFGLASDDPKLLTVCNSCTYPPDGCDFRNPATKAERFAPCGGLRALAALLSAGVTI
jgi:hypothetical protein